MCPSVCEEDPGGGAGVGGGACFHCAPPQQQSDAGFELPTHFYFDGGLPEDWSGMHTAEFSVPQRFCVNADFLHCSFCVFRVKRRVKRA